MSSGQMRTGVGIWGRGGRYPGSWGTLPVFPLSPGKAGDRKQLPAPARKAKPLPLWSLSLCIPHGVYPPRRALFTSGPPEPPPKKGTPMTPVKDFTNVSVSAKVPLTSLATPQKPTRRVQKGIKFETWETWGRETWGRYPGFRDLPCVPAFLGLPPTRGARKRPLSSSSRAIRDAIRIFPSCRAARSAWAW
jgi:hypothetical protein